MLASHRKKTATRRNGSVTESSVKIKALIRSCRGFDENECSTEFGLAEDSLLVRLVVHVFPEPVKIWHSKMLPLLREYMTTWQNLLQDSMFSARNTDLDLESNGRSRSSVLAKP